MQSGATQVLASAKRKRENETWEKRKDSEQRVGHKILEAEGFARLRHELGRVFD